VDELYGEKIRNLTQPREPASAPPREFRDVQGLPAVDAVGPPEGGQRVPVHRSVGPARAPGATRSGQGLTMERLLRMSHTLQKELQPWVARLVDTYA
jgi:hypothetical protein